MNEKQRILVENGRMPFGAYKGQYFDALENSVIIKIAESLNKSNINQMVNSKIGPLYDKLVSDMEKIRLSNINNIIKESYYFGHIGDRVEKLELVIGFTFHIKKTGVSLISLEDTLGRKFVIFYKGNDTLKRGESIKLSGNISKHQEYNGEKQTILTKVELNK